jgi:hypothetical protein
MSLHGLLPRVGVQTWPGPFVTWIDNNAHAFSCTDEVYPKPPLNSASLHLESPSATVIITNNAMQFMFLSVTPSLDICVFQIQCLMLQCSSSPIPPTQKHACSVAFPAAVPRAGLRDGARCIVVYVFAVAILGARCEGAAVLALGVFLF